MSASAPRAAFSRVLYALIQVAISLGLLGWLWLRLDFASLHAARAHPSWLGLTLLCTLPAYTLAAGRWSFTATRLGVGLGFGQALREVYAANLLNCLLPTGLAGDALRVARHAQSLRRDEVPSEACSRAEPRASTRPWRAALAAVLLERFSGQLVLWALVAFSLAGWSEAVLLRAASWAALVLVPLGLWLWLRRAFARAAPGSRLWRALHQALIARGAIWVQLATSGSVLLCCMLGFYCAARGLGVPLSGRDALRIVPALLLASALPVSVGGFGVREASSAALYGAAGLDPGTGAAVAGLFGVSNLLGALPGAATLWSGLGPRP